MPSRSLIILVLAAACTLVSWPCQTLAGEVLPERVDGELVLSGSYSLEGGMTIEKGAVLVLAPGARLEVSSEGSITVQGTIRAEGSGDRPVRIFPADDSSWEGITLLSGAVCEMENALVERARNGISVLAARIRISGGAITGAGTAIHLVREADARILGVRFKDNKVAVAAEMRSTGQISGCRFESNRIGVGVASGATPSVARNLFTGNDIGIQVLQRYPGKIEDNLFEGNKVGVRLYQNGPDTVVERNRFEESSEAAVMALSYTSPLIRNNLMTGGKFGVYANQFSSPRIVNNEIEGMEVGIHLNKKNVSQVTLNVLKSSRVAIFCDFSSYPHLRDNLFQDNEMHVKLGRFQSSNWESRAGSRNFVLETAARQGSRNPKLAQGTKEFPEAVDATGNWWDEKTLKEMREKGGDADITSIYDGQDLPEVTYEGFGKETYRLDKVLYEPTLGEKPGDAGLVGWKGTADELAALD